MRMLPALKLHNYSEVKMLTYLKHRKGILKE